MVLNAHVHNVGERSSVASKEYDKGPVDKNVLIKFKDHISYAIGIEN